MNVKIEKQEDNKVKKVLLLCASHNDLGLINGLRKLGYYIYATGAIPGLIGEKYIDEYICADYSNQELILDIARELQIDNICACCNDFGVYTAAYVAEKMGLPGYDSYETTLILNNKDKFKKFAKENGILSPEAVSFTDKQEAIRYCYSKKLPLISKAVDLSAGNGIGKIRTYDEISFVIDDSFAKSRVKRIVIEPFISGTQHGFCTFLINKKVAASCSNDEYSVLNPYRVEIDTFPANGIDACEERLIGQVEKIADLLDLKDGIFHLQYIEDQAGPHIIEVMRRVIGNMYGIPASALCGFDWDYWEARAKMGLTCDALPGNIPRDGFFAYKAILAEKNGAIQKIEFPERYAPFLIGKCLLKRVGDEITDYMSQPVGFVFLRFPSEKTMYEFLVVNYCNDIVLME